MGPVEEKLRETWELIKDPDNRCTGSYARNCLNEEVEPLSDEACKWCAIGALYKTTNFDTYNLKELEATELSSRELLRSGYSYLIQAKKNLRINTDIMRFNDSDVKNNPPKLYAEAIRLAEEAGV